MNQELDHFKRLDFATLVARLGYERDHKSSSGASTVLRTAAGDKVVVKLNGDDWVYFSVHDQADHGTIVDFVQRRTGGNLGQVRKTIRDLSGHGFSLPVARSSGSSSTNPDLNGRKKSLAVWNASRWNPEHPYLLDRGLDRATLADPRVLDTYRQDHRGNVIFPHRDRQGLCGYELRNVGFKSFGKDVKKGLWITANLKTASAIVIVESAIDALSHCQLYQLPLAYVALGGSIGTRQRDLLTGLFAKAHARNALVIVATDNDRAGDGFFDDLSLLAPMRLKRHRAIGKDWTDDLVFCNHEQGGIQWN